MVSAAGEREALHVCLYVYVDDADAVLLDAFDRGAECIEAPWDAPYGDRRGMVRDPWSNI